MHPFSTLSSLARSLQCLQLIFLPLPQYVHWDLPNGSTSDVNKLLKIQATPFLKRILVHLDVNVLGVGEENENSKTEVAQKKQELLILYYE